MISHKTIKRRKIMNKSIKRFLSFVMTVAIVATTVFGSDVTTAFAKTNKNAIKTVTLKIGKSNVTKKTKALKVGSSATISVVVNPTSAKKSVAFKSSNVKVAAVTKAGKVSAKKAGTAKITATVTGKNGKKTTAYTTVKVSNVEVTSVKLNKKSATLNKGDKVVLKATVAPSNATVKTVTWTSSDKSVATVSNGVVTAVGSGTATITAKAGKKVAKCTIGVLADAIPVAGVTINQETVSSIAVSANTTLSATVVPENATNKGVTWSSSDTKIATVDQNGVVKGIAPGKATIKVVSNDGGFSDERVVLVTGTSNKNASKVEIAIANAIQGYKDEEGKPIENTVLTGTDADVRVRVLDEDGNPVGLTEVVLASKCNKYGNGEEVFTLKNSEVAKTDADGYVDFVFGEKTGLSYTSVDPYYESYVLTATAVGAGVSASTELKFAFINLSGIEVVNNHDADPDNDIVPSDNAVSGDDGVFETHSMNGARLDEYVNSQQVSLADVDDHKVTFSATPELIVPASSGATSSEEWRKEVGFTSTDYSVYNDEDNANTTCVIENVPAGLQSATINFTNLKLSEYTKLVIKVCKAGTNVPIVYEDEHNVLKEKIYEVYKDSNTDNIKKEAHYQVPLQEDVDVDIIISIESQGQVNDDINDGYSVNDITGIWVSSAGKKGKEIELDGTVTWEQEDPLYDFVNEMTFDEAKKYIPSDAANAKYLNSKYKYYYQIPSFKNGRSGDAIIKVVNGNDQVQAYYLYPTINKYIIKTNAYGVNYREYVNENIIPDENYVEYPGAIGIRVGEEEINYMKSVGTITKEGNNVTVDSKESGVTVLKATIDVPGLTADQLSPANGKVLYTSINWCPRPKDDDKSDDFFAIQGQQVEVIAQLYDDNGNKKTESGATIEFTYNAIKKGIDIEESDIGTSLGTTGVTLLTGTKLKTDENGQARLILKSTDYNKYIKYIQATSEKYNVRLSIANQETVLANIYWIDAGISFTDKVDVNDDKHISVKGKEYINYTNETNIVKQEDIDNRKVGTHWIFGYQVVGRTSRPATEIMEITNVPITIAKDSTGAVDLEGCPNGVAKLYSETVGSTKLNGSISGESFDVANTANVVFTIKDEYGIIKEYKNVGTGVPTINATLELPISWETDGTYVSVVSPNGKTIDKDLTTKIYVKIEDKYHNPVKKHELKYSITGINKADNVSAKTNDYGLCEIELPAPGTEFSATNYTSTITASVDDDAIISEALDIVYTDKKTSKVALVNANYKNTVEVNGSKMDVISATFSTPVAIIDKDLFTVENGATPYPVKNVEISSEDRRTVLITVDDKEAIANLTDKTAITVKVAASIVGEDNMEHKLIDANGKALDSGFLTVSFNRPNDVKLKAEYNDGKITVTATEANAAITLNGSKVFAVADVASVFKVSGKNVGVLKGTGSSTSIKFTANPTDTDTTVRIYYDGQSYEVVVKAKSE